MMYSTILSPLRTRWLKQSLTALLLLVFSVLMNASSHREAPLISNDPLADNVDVYAFRSPDNPDMVSIIATYVPFQLPQGGPNYYKFGENVRYEIHVDNDASKPGDEVTYRFTFKIVNEDPSTFFNIRLGKQNQKASYDLERSMDGGKTFQMIVQGGVVPPNNIGPRSIEGGAGLNSNYETLWRNAVTTSSTGERIFAGPSDDPFFVDLGGIFDLGDAPRQKGTPSDGVACYNVSTIAIQVPIATLRKAGAASTPTNILDPDYVIGVWASASRPAIRTLSKESGPSYSGDWIQVSRLGMPLTNEAVIPIGDKDYWNSITPYDEITDTRLDGYFYNPELALYMDDDLFGGAVPALSPLRIQENSLGAFDFTNGADGLFGLKGSDAVQGTALDDAIFGTLLLPGPGQPRSIDLWPAFHTGVPNFPPYQLATGKEGNPLAPGKPFVNNFLPNGGDMLRLNMAVPITQRVDPNFSSLGLIQAAAIGLTVAPYNTRTDLEFIPNMDGFPNGRRLEDDVTRIELQAVSGVVLAAVGLWYDDFNPAESASPVTQDLLNVLTFSTGVEMNDRPFTTMFPHIALPFSGAGDCGGRVNQTMDECLAKGGNLMTIEGDVAISICVDGEGDPFDVLLTDNIGSHSVWVITDAEGNILGLPQAGPFDLDGAGIGECNLYNLSFSGEISGLDKGENIGNISGCHMFSNPIVVTREDRSICNPASCPTPQDITLKKISKSKVSVHWDRVDEAKSYEVLIGIQGQPKSFFVYPVRGRNVFISGPANKTTVVQVRTVCKNGERSEYSDELTFTASAGKSLHSKSLQKGLIQVSELEQSESLGATPNPTFDELRIEYNTRDRASVMQIYDLQGRVVLSQNMAKNQSEHRVDMSRLSEGMYLISISSDGESNLFTKVVKTNK